MTRRIFGRRIAVDRAGVAEHTGAARSTVNLWHRNRDTTGFPPAFTGPDGAEWFWLDQITAFHSAHRAAKLAELTTVDRSGDPRELVGSGEAARILRYRSYRNLPGQLREQPDDIEILSDGRLRRRWYRRTVWAIADARTGRQSTGRTPGSNTGRRKPHPYADDPRLQAATDLLTESQVSGRDRRGLGVELAAASALPSAPRNGCSPPLRPTTRLAVQARGAPPVPRPEAPRV